LFVIPIIILLVVLALPGVAIFFLAKMAAGLTIAIVLTVIYGLPAFLLFIYACSVLTVPVTAFFTVFAVEMVKKLEDGAKKAGKPKKR